MWRGESPFCAEKRAIFLDAAPIRDRSARRVSIPGAVLGLNRRFTLGRRSGRASPIERLAHSAEVIENPLDDGWLLDARNHPKLAAAAPVGFDVDVRG